MIENKDERSSLAALLIEEQAMPEVKPEHKNGHLRKWELADVSKWKVRELKTYNRDARDPEKFIENQCCEIIVSWPFPGDPSNPDDYDDLEGFQFAEVQRRLGDHVGAVFQERKR